MIILSSLVKFALYSLFIIFSVNYLTKNRLDDNSKYLIMALLIIPYLFIDTLTNSTHENQNDNESFSVDVEPSKINMNKIQSINKQPEIILSKKEEITNKNVDEELRLKEEIKQKNIEHFNAKSDDISEEQIRKIINLIKKEKLIERLDDSSNLSGLVQTPNNTTPPIVPQTSNGSNSSNVSLSSDPSLQPLGMNGSGFTNEWDQDYILLSTDKWAPTMKPAPVCKAEKECPVCPSLTSGYPISVREFDLSRKIMPPIAANVTSMNK
jgi:hypothetical protein